MTQKQITDLDTATSFDPGDLLLLRKTGEGIDKKIDQATFIRTLGNPSITGFTATSTVANQVILASANDVIIDTYYNGMIISFISPITSTAAVNIKIGSLPLKTLKQIGTDTTSLLEVNKFYSAIYIGDFATGSFYQTNIVQPFIHTNEYLAHGVIAGDELSTTYTLTTAYGSIKSTYYNAMSILFTSDIDSKGAIIINVDGLDNKTLSDPAGDDIPFSLSANEAVLAIYDGTVFRKHIFSTLEPEPDPIDPPIDIVINVGTTRAIKKISDAILQLTRNYGEDGQGRTATIQLDSDFIYNESYYIETNTPWITIKTAIGGNSFISPIQLQKKANINFSGIFNTNINGSFILAYQGNNNNARCIFKNSTINHTLSTVTTALCLEVRSLNTELSTSDAIVFNNVNINGFKVLYTANFGNAGIQNSAANFRYDTGIVVMSNTTSGSDQPIIVSYGTVTLQNVNFGDVTRNSVALFYVNRVAFFNNVTITTGGDINIVSIQNSSNSQSVLTNCSMRNTTTSTVPSITSAGGLIVDGGDYRHPTSSSTPDIFAQDYANAIIRLRNNPLGSTGKSGKGQIINE